MLSVYLLVTRPRESAWSTHASELEPSLAPREDSPHRLGQLREPLLHAGR
jgi:hypothetical protein